MALTFDAASQGETSAGTSLTVSHTCGATATILILGVATYSTPATVTATYNGVAMTEVPVSNQLYGVGSTNRLTCLYLVNPASGAHNIVITASVSNEIVMGAVSYLGGDTTTPQDGSAKTSATGPPITQNIVSETNDLVVDVTSTYQPGVLTAGAGQTERVNNNNGGTNESLGMSEEAGAASVTMSWSASTGITAIGQIGLNLNIAALAGGPFPPWRPDPQRATLRTM